MSQDRRAIGRRATAWTCMLGFAFGLAGLSGIPALVPIGSASAASGPSATASTPVTSAGQLVEVNGTGWSDVGGVATVQICGQDAVNLTSDCDEANTYSAGIGSGGTFHAGLFTHIPQTPCPCVIFVTDEFGQSTKIPIQIVGAPVEPIIPSINPLLPLAMKATLDTPTSVSSWFGGPKDVDLSLRVKNTSGAALPSPVVSVRVGRGDSPTEFVAGQRLATLPVGASRVVHIPLTIPAVTFGHYTVEVQAAVDGTTVTTSVQTSSWPWAWLVIAIQLILIVIVLILRRLRRGRDFEAEPPPLTESRVTEPSGVHSEFVH